MDERAIIEQARALAPGRRPTAFLRILQGLAPDAGRMKLAYLVRQSVPTMPLSALKRCHDWQGYGGALPDAAVDAEMLPFMPPPPFTRAPCPTPWTAGRPGGPELPPDFAALLQAGAPPDAQAVIGDWLERQGDDHAAALRSAQSWAPQVRQDRFGLRATLALGAVEWGFRWIPPGRFQMGAAAAQGGRRYAADQTLHTVRLTRGYWLAETPLTQAGWAAAALPLPDISGQTGPEHPAHGLSWVDATAVCAALSERLGIHMRLPTEAEWECACRAGTTTCIWLGARPGARLDAIAWHEGNCDGVQPVARTQPNPLGLFDMLGNVAEWCADWYGQYAGDATDPLGPAQGTERVQRGEHWRFAGDGLSAAGRQRGWPERRHGRSPTALRPVIDPLRAG